jgi:thiamine pyrophosphate-dependent acetolactate synthase large subunit-like protein
MDKSTDTSTGRREFLKAAAGGAGALVAGGSTLFAQAGPAAGAAETPPAGTSEVTRLMTTERPGSDFMTDVLKTLDFDYVVSNPGSSFRGLQESLINYGKNTKPEWITACHEEQSVAMAHAYFKIEGKPLAIMAHGTVGLQHASMAIYNAFCDRVPVFIILGNHLDAAMRRPGAEWSHAVQDAAAMVRDYTKWDDTPHSLAHFAESAVRAYRIAMTPPMEPVVLTVDGELAEHPIDVNAKIRIPRLILPSPPAGEPGAVEEAARMLVNAQYPVILGGRLGRNQKSIELLVELAETLQAATDGGGMPSRHPLNGGANVQNADVILALELPDLWGAANNMVDQLERYSQSRLAPNAKIISIAATELFSRSNYQDFQRFQDADLPIAASAEATLPSLIEACKRLITTDRKNTLADRGRKIAAMTHAARQRALTQAAAVWDLSPISPARIHWELWNLVKNKDWSIVNGGVSEDVFDFSKHYQRTGGSGGGGVGYGAPAAVGAALANKKHGRLSITIQNDGDLMYVPGVLWTAAHHRVPLLSIMNNNRAYHQEVMHLQRMACRHNRDLTTAAIGNVITDPDVDFAKLAQSMGWYAEGPITNPNDVGPALKRAIEVVEKGEPALLDTVMQPR